MAIQIPGYSIIIPIFTWLIRYWIWVFGRRTSDLVNPESDLRCGDWIVGFGIEVLARKAKNQYTWKGFEAIPKALKELKDEGLKENFSSFDGNDDSKVSDDEEDDERISDTRTESQPDKLNPSLNLKSSASSKPENRREKSLALLTQNFVKGFAGF
ncbi:hypothetical protein F8388_016897 [Cannabis sativa]|uniref:Uncharacterized protein n=1 Tax=Cannabis sativa TaxID=3483 RepID=A0A7J6ERT2_CANSA|nr:hypothetical protein F8388_016897 [Cannabis sativa]